MPRGPCDPYDTRRFPYPLPFGGIPAPGLV